MRYLLPFLLLASYALAFEALVDPKTGDVIVAREEGAYWTEREQREFLIIQIVDGLVDDKIAAKKGKQVLPTVVYPFYKKEDKQANKAAMISEYRVDLDVVLSAGEKAQVKDRNVKVKPYATKLDKGSAALRKRTAATLQP